MHQVNYLIAPRNFCKGYFHYHFFFFKFIQIIYKHNNWFKKYFFYFPFNFYLSIFSSLNFLKSSSIFKKLFFTFRILFFLYIIPFQYVYCYSFVVPNDLSLIIVKKLVKNVWKKTIMNSRKKSVKNVILKINLSAYKWFIKSPSR